MRENKYYYGTGSRKTAVARVYLEPGTGEFLINNRSVDNYFSRDTLRMIIRQPLELTGTVDQFNIKAFVRGGGTSGQAGAIRHGITRALMDFNLELRPRLKRAGFVTRDPRVKERKKYGRPGARKRFQFSKR